MSSWGRLAISVGGAIVGNMIAPGIGSAIGFFGGSILGSMIFPMDYEGERPEFSDYPLQSSTKGQPVTVLIGTKEIAGNIIYLGPEDPYYIKHESGGKGGGDTSTSYEARYRRSFLIALCEGEAWIRKCYKGKEEILLSEFTTFPGDGNEGLSDLIGEDWTDYKNVCCAWFEDYELGNSPALPNFVFEVQSMPVGPDIYFPAGNVGGGEDGIYVFRGLGYPRIEKGSSPVDEGYSGAYKYEGFYIKNHGMVNGEWYKASNFAVHYNGALGYVLDASDPDYVIMALYAVYWHYADVYTGEEYFIRQVRFGATVTSHLVFHGDYIYVSGQGLDVAATTSTLIRLNKTTLEVDDSWVAVTGFNVGLRAAVSSDGLYIIHRGVTGTYTERTCCVRISDATVIWSLVSSTAYPGENGGDSSFCLESDGQGHYFGGGRSSGLDFPPWTVYLRYPSLFNESDGSLYKEFISTSDIAWQGGSGSVTPSGLAFAVFLPDFNKVLHPSGVVFFGSDYEYNYSGYLTSSIIMFDVATGEELGNWRIGEVTDSVGNGFLKGGNMVWYNGCLYVCAIGQGKIYRFPVGAASIDGLGNVSYSLSPSHVNLTPGYSQAPIVIGWDGRIWVPKVNDTSGYPIVRLNADDLTVYDEIQATWGVHASVWYSYGYPHSTFDISAGYYDEYPPNIIYMLLTDPRKGIGLPRSLLNMDTFNDELTYCQANDIKMSLALTDQKPMADWLQYICTHFMGYLYESNGKICLGSMRPKDSVFAITQDDLVREGENPPVKIKPRDYSETYNRIEAVWSDRDNRYRETPVPAFDEVDQRISGFLRHKTVDLKGFHDPDLAARMAWLNFINAMYRFKTYAFTVGWKHLAIEVGDVGTLDDGHRVSNQTVRIISINLAKDGKNIQIEAVEDITALYPTLTNYTAQQSLRQATPTVTLASGSVAFRESTTEAKLMLAITPGGAQTNGWYIYRSYDNISYDLVGRATIDGVTGGDANSAGTLQTNLPAHTAVVHRKDEAFDVSIGTVTDLDTAVTDDSFFNNRKLAKIGDEIIAYRDCVESATEGTWRVSNLIRGLFGTEPAAHLAGETFQTLDTSFTYALTESDIGKTLYFKVVSFYGSKVQSVSEVSAASVQVQGLSQRPFTASLPRLQADENDIADAEYSGSSFTLYWNLPGTKGTGFNQGGFDLNVNYPIWRYGDPESQLVGGDGAPYGHFLADAELQGIDLVFEQTDGTFIGQRSVDPTANSEVISVADDLGGNADAVIKIYPRRSYRSVEPAQLQVTGV